MLVVLSSEQTGEAAKNGTSFSPIWTVQVYPLVLNYSLHLSQC